MSQPPAPPVLPTPRWDVAPGSLRTQLEHWAMRAHYQLIWKATHDFELEARADFEAEIALHPGAPRIVEAPSGQLVDQIS